MASTSNQAGTTAKLYKINGVINFTMDQGELFGLGGDYGYIQKLKAAAAVLKDNRDTKEYTLECGDVITMVKG